MLHILASAVLIPISYNLGPGVKANYNVQVGFDGYIPLLGGNEGKVEVKMGVFVEGLPSTDTSIRAASEIRSFSVTYNGEALPFGVENVKEFFPRTSVTLSPGGRVLKTDAPDANLPFRLPGLDQKRFPDITYLPIEFPEPQRSEKPQEPLELGKPFSFKKRFGDSDVTYKVTPIKLTDAALEMEIAMEQVYETFEDAGGNSVGAEKDAARKVKTIVKGSGTATFDRSRGLVSKLDVSADADSDVTELVGAKAASKRKLKTRLRVELQKPAEGSP